MSSLREARNLWRVMQDAQGAGHRVCLAMITQVQGSAYRRPGAKMMMADSGQMAGTLSGGCLEGDLYMYAQDVMKSQQPTTRHYDLTEDDMWGLGIGCKGQIDVIIEPVDVTHPFWEAYGAALEADQPFCLGMDLAQGERFIRRGTKVTTCSGHPVRPVAEEVYGQTVVRGHMILDHLTPPERLVVAGAGHDAKPLAALAHQAGFEVSIVDPRKMFNNSQMFPSAVEWVDTNAQDIAADRWPHAYWAIMNHQQDRDEKALQLALRSSPQYVGVLGPRSRTQEMLRHIGVTGEDLARLSVFSPVGLDLGAETPEEVAISMVAEMMAARNHCAGGHLNGRERIHQA